MSAILFDFAAYKAAKELGLRSLVEKDESHIITTLDGFGLSQSVSFLDGGYRRFGLIRSFRIANGINTAEIISSGIAKPGIPTKDIRAENRAVADFATSEKK